MIKNQIDMMSKYRILHYGSIGPLPKALDRGTASVAVKTGAFFIAMHAKNLKHPFVQPDT